MAHRDSDDEVIDAIVARDMLTDNPNFTPRELAAIRQSPGLLQKLTDPLEVKKRYIYVLFSVALGLAAASKVIEYTGIAQANAVLHDLLTNVLFSVSIELFGAAAVAFVMELVFEQRVRRNRELVTMLASEHATGHAGEGSALAASNPDAAAPATPEPL